MKKKTLLLSALTLALSANMAAITPAQATLPTSVQGQQLPSLSNMLEKVLPSVVSINVKGTKVHNQRLPPELKFFFGPNFPTEQQSKQAFTSLGSGVIIDAQKGYVLTNNHVISDAEQIKIQINDGREFEATLVGSDAQSDVALLEIKKPKNLIAIKMADSDALRVGDFSVAVGNPFGLGQTVTSGIISALGRSGLNIEGLENFIQTDASINRGNSGGALVNLNGELIGINTAILAPGGGNIGIGFAIPSNMAQALSKQLIEHGEVKRGSLGIRGGEVTPEIAKVFDSKAQRGAFISEVMPKSAAEKAGIKSGDILISIEGKTVASFSQLRAKIATTAPGSSIKIGLLRNGQEKTVTVIVDGIATAVKQQTKLQGATLSAGQKGVEVSELEKNSVAAQMGLRKGDIISAINRQPIKTVAQLNKILDSKPDVLALNVIRGNSNLYLLLR